MDESFSRTGLAMALAYEEVSVPNPLISLPTLELYLFFEPC